MHFGYEDCLFDDEDGEHSSRGDCQCTRPCSRPAYDPVVTPELRLEESPKSAEGHGYRDCVITIFCMIIACSIVLSIGAWDIAHDGSGDHSGWAIAFVALGAPAVVGLVIGLLGVLVDREIMRGGAGDFFG